MGYQTVDFFKSTPYKTIKTDQLLIKITLLNIADLNEITNNHDNELTERKDPVVAFIAAAAATAVGAHVLVRKFRRKIRGKK